MNGRTKLALALALMTLNPSVVRAGQFDLPDPKVFQRTQDQERARLLTKPCADADIGRGCQRYNGRLEREVPCSFPAGRGTIAFLPTDQCYAMEAPRRYRGIWIDRFEDQQFIPDGSLPPEWPSDDPATPGWRDRAERARLARIWLDTTRLKVSANSRYRGTRRLIEFVGRQTRYPGEYGHVGMFGQEIVADQMISLRDCPATGPCG